MFYQILFSAQVEHSAIITYKNVINELPHELLNNLRLRILRNFEMSTNCLSLIEWLCSLVSKMKFFLTLEETSSKMEIKLYPLCATSHEN